MYFEILHVLFTDYLAELIKLHKDNVHLYYKNVARSWHARNRGNSIWRRWTSSFFSWLVSNLRMTFLKMILSVRAFGEWYYACACAEMIFFKNDFAHYKNKKLLKFFFYRFQPPILESNVVDGKSIMYFPLNSLNSSGLKKFSWKKKTKHEIAIFEIF